MFILNFETSFYITMLLSVLIWYLVYGTWIGAGEIPDTGSAVPSSEIME